VAIVWPVSADVMERKAKDLAQGKKNQANACQAAALKPFTVAKVVNEIPFEFSFTKVVSRRRARQI
jgi:hypothetical protein